MNDPTPRLLVVGLDSASSRFLFDICLPVMPNLRRLLPAAWRGPLRTTDPPISLPAWAVMFTGVDPGTLGMYGFRHRLDHSYTQSYGPASDSLPVPTLWKLLSDRGRRVAVVGMPPGFPPPAVNGLYVSDFLTPPGAREWTYPPELAREIESRFGRYTFDVTFRAQERERLFENIVEMTQARFAVAEALYSRERWDVFAIHEVGTDRLHHAYTKYFDPTHPGYVPGNPFEHVLLDYYRVIDQSLGRLISLADRSTRIVIVSDHGSMPMAGCFCINQWLAENGYLVLRETPPAGTPLERAAVDWGATRVWGAGGYYSRIFFNIKGRDPQGTVDARALPALKRKLIEDLNRVRTPDGRPMATRIFEPGEVYRMVRGDPPDLMVYLDELRWRSAGTLGYPSLYLRENDTGPDDAVHHPEGVFLYYDPNAREGGVLPAQEILDVTPTLLTALGEPVPDHIQGRPIQFPRPEISRTPTI